MDKAEAISENSQAVFDFMALWNQGIIPRDISPVHVVLVSLLVDQLYSLFLPFFGRPKKLHSKTIEATKN